jgi:thiamine biosynthesis lipoprotein
VFSPYRPDSLVSRVDRGEVSLAEAARDADVAEVLDLGARAERATGGAFCLHRPRPDGSTAFDPSGVVKGWAAERAAAALRALDDTDFCLSAGGDVLGRAAETPWRIGVEDPHDPGRLVAVVPVRDGAVATSGTAHRGAHLVDARTGHAPAGVASVTVVARSLTWADIDATAAYALGPDAVDWLRHRVGRSGLVVHTDGRTTVVDPVGR